MFLPELGGFFPFFGLSLRWRGWGRLAFTTMMTTSPRRRSYLFTISRAALLTKNDIPDRNVISISSRMKLSCTVRAEDHDAGAHGLWMMMLHTSIS